MLFIRRALDAGKSQGTAAIGDAREKSDKGRPTFGTLMYMYTDESLTVSEGELEKGIPYGNVGKPLGLGRASNRTKGGDAGNRWRVRC